jgi:hypothetical protein
MKNMFVRRAQLAVLIACGLGFTGCSSSGTSSTWSWNPWAKSDTSAVASADKSKPALPSGEASKVASKPASTTAAPTTPVNYPMTQTPVANFSQGTQTPTGSGQVVMGQSMTNSAGPQVGAYGTPGYGAPANPGMMPASYTANGFGAYGQQQPVTTAGAMTPGMTMPQQPNMTMPAANNGMTAPGNWAAPTMPQLQLPPATSAPVNSFPTSALPAPNMNSMAAAPTAMPRDDRPFTPGGTSRLNTSVVPAGYEAKPMTGMTGTAPAGMTCENGICYPAPTATAPANQVINAGGSTMPATTVMPATGGLVLPAMPAGN